MHHILSLLSLAFVFFQVAPAISYPRPGDTLQGLVTIVGTDQIMGYVSSEISFAFSGDSTGTWFLISKSEQGVLDSKLGEWDTSLISDGNYVLRLRILLDDGTEFDLFIEDLRIRNYTPLETPILSPTASMPLRTSEVVIPTILTATRIPLSPNPLELTRVQFYNSLGIGILAILTCFLLVFLYIKLRWK